MSTYRHAVEFSFIAESQDVKQFRNFMDELRAFLDKYDIDQYEDAVQEITEDPSAEAHTIKAETKFSKTFSSLEEFRSFLDEVRNFFRSKGIKRHSYRAVQTRERPTKFHD